MRRGEDAGRKKVRQWEEDKGKMRRRKGEDVEKKNGSLALFGKSSKVRMERGRWVKRRKRKK